MWVQREEERDNWLWGRYAFYGEMRNEGYFSLCDEDDFGIRPMEGFVSSLDKLSERDFRFRVSNVSAW